MRQPPVTELSRVEDSSEECCDPPRTGEQSERDGERLPRAVEPASSGRSKLGHHRHCTAELTASRQSLQNSKDRQEQRCQNSDALVGGEHTDQGRRTRHKQKNDHQGGASADAVTESTEQRGPPTGRKKKASANDA